MPKRLLILLAAVSLGLAIPACSNNNNSGSVTPTAGPSGTPNPSITAATILVTILQTPAAHVPVQESTPKSTSSPRPGTPFVTQTTGPKGMTTFKHLKPSQLYCWVAILGPHQTSSQCAVWQTWQFQQIPLGT